MDTIQKENCAAYSYADLCNEYVLPDYYPEVRKVLNVRVSLLPMDTYASGNKGVCTGKVRYTLLYLGAENLPASAVLDADFEVSCPIPDGECILHADVMSEGANVRLTAPRKLSIRSRVRAAFHALTEDALTLEIEGDLPEGGMEEKRATTTCVRQRYFTSDKIYLTESEHVQSPAESVRILAKSGDVLVRECRTEAGGILLRGDVYLRCLICADDGLPYEISKKLPFDANVPTMPAEGARYLARGRVSDLDLSVSVGDGDGAEILMDATVECECEELTESEVGYTEDLFSTTGTLTPNGEERTVRTLAGCSMGNFSIGGSIAKSECGATGATRVVDAYGVAQIESVECKHGKAVVCGNTRVSLLYLRAAEDADAGVACAEFSSPFRIETDCATGDGECDFECNGSIVFCHGRMDDSALLFDGELAITVKAIGKKTIHPILSARYQAEEREESSDLLLYYPCEGETLWEVAKKYRVAPAHLAESNERDVQTVHEPITDRHCLLIP